MSIETPLRVGTFQKDSRLPIEEVYRALEQLTHHGWEQQRIHVQEGKTGGGRKVVLPVYGYISPQWHENPGLWVLVGVHGEEPAPSNALAQHVRTLLMLAEAGIPILCTSILNPLGYIKKWRYPNELWNPDFGASVGDSEHVLLNEIESGPRTRKPISFDAECITVWALTQCVQHPPVLVFDHHEDEFSPEPDSPQARASYTYYHGEHGLVRIAEDVVDVLHANDMPIAQDGETAFGEKIIYGVVRNAVDGSVDELISAPRVFFRGGKIEKPAAKAVIIIETGFDPGVPHTLDQRVVAQGAVMNRYETYWNMMMHKILPSI